MPKASAPSGRSKQPSQAPDKPQKEAKTVAAPVDATEKAPRRRPARSKFSDKDAPDFFDVAAFSLVLALLAALILRSMPAAYMVTALQHTCSPVLDLDASQQSSELWLAENTGRSLSRRPDTAVLQGRFCHLGRKDHHVSRVVYAWHSVFIDGLCHA